MIATEQVLRSRILEYLKDHPDAWTRDVHRAAGGLWRYWPFMVIMKQMEFEKLIVGKRHTNNNIRWSLKQK